jgi:transcription elongation factor Elf1
MMPKLSKAPVFCKDCGARNSWEHRPEADIKSESGQVMWERWECTICGHSTIIPVSQVAEVALVDKGE